MIQKNDFLSIIDATPLVSIDLIIENNKEEILLGKRLNRPARGYWFVPGGRIRKNEHLPEAMARISLDEIGTELSFQVAVLLGAYEHIYDDNYAGTEGINTHYVVLGYKFNIQNTLNLIHDDQHAELRWWPKDELLASDEVHENTKAYFY